MQEINEKLKKPYSPKEEELSIQKIWEESELTNPDKDEERKNSTPYTIIMPPPNVTGILHMGHALMLTLEDILIRYKRLQGHRTLWLPGTDHAAIATQVRVEKDLQKKDGLSRFDLGRDNFLKLVEEFAQKSHSTITSQIKRLGSSCDWSREAFTLDKKRHEAVFQVFKKMKEDNLIYKGKKVVNFDVKGGTTVSDDEIIYEKRKAILTTFYYSKDIPIPVSTTRLETKIGDTAIAVNADDTRYQKYIGQEFNTIFCGSKLKLKVIADKEVDIYFGTGALGVTPAHSKIDEEIAKRHNLPTIQVINERGRICLDILELKDKKALEAREIIRQYLKDNNLIIKEEEIDQEVATAERTGGIIEPLPKEQWFVDVNKKFPYHHNTLDGINKNDLVSLKDLMHHAVEKGLIQIHPDYFKKIYFNWINNLQDWCISRQIWYGHRIPVWYKDEEIIISKENPDKENNSYIQDEDTLDTWFSSALWTFSTLGYPDLNSKDFKVHHPTDVLETGYEIIFFWVARMILMSTYIVGQIPFKKVLFHGTVRDDKGRKMSKSLGNGIDPLEISDKYGADACRLALVLGTSKGTDIKINEDKIRGMKNFGNKIWNIARYVLENTEKENFENIFKNKISGKNKNQTTLLNKLEKTKKELENDFENFDIHLGAEKIYHFIWDDFASLYIEESKKELKEDNFRDNSKDILAYTLYKSLILLHPLTPHVTESIYQILPIKNKKLLMIENW